MKLFLSIAFTFMALGTTASNAAVEAEMLYGEYPDALVCLHNSGGHTYERIYKISILSETDIVRYDGPNASELIHFFVDTGLINHTLSPPTYIDCVIDNMSISDLVANGRALNMYTPVPSGSKF